MKVVTFGEIMQRLSPNDGKTIAESSSFDTYFGGSEANVAIALSHFGHHACFVSAIPKNELGDACIDFLQKQGVDTSFILRQGDKLGRYFTQYPLPGIKKETVYDRAGSAIAKADPKDFDWEKILRGADWFHFSGITPALSETAFEATLEACKMAKKLGVPVSCDLNYRAALWSKEKAHEAMMQLVPYLDVCIENEDEADIMLGVKSDLQGRERISDVAKKLADQYHFILVSSAWRDFKEGDPRFGGMVYKPENGHAYFAKEYPVENLLDSAGGGDSFSAALIHCMLEKTAPQEMAEFCTVFGTLKYGMKGDTNHASIEDVHAFMLKYA